MFIHTYIHTHIYICSHSIVSCTYLHIERPSSYSCGASSEMPLLKGGALTRRVCLAAAKGFARENRHRHAAERERYESEQWGEECQPDLPLQ